MLFFRRRLLLRRYEVLMQIGNHIVILLCTTQLRNMLFTLNMLFTSVALLTVWRADFCEVSEVEGHSSLSLCSVPQCSHARFDKTAQVIGEFIAMSPRFSWSLKNVLHSWKVYIGVAPQLLSHRYYIQRHDLHSLAVTQPQYFFTQSQCLPFMQLCCYLGTNG